MRRQACEKGEIMSVKKHLSLPAQMGVGMLLGVAAGALVQHFDMATS